MGIYYFTKEEREKVAKTIEKFTKRDILDSKIDHIISFASDDDIEIRRTTYLTIGSIYRDSKKLRENILDRLRNLYESQNEKVRHTVVYAVSEIGKINFDEILDMLEISLFDNHHSVRNAVACSLKQLCKKNPEPTLKFAKNLLHHPDPNVRRAIISGTELRGRTHPEDILPLLFEVQNDADTDVRKEIVRVLGKISYRKGCLKKVVGALNCWENKEIVEKAKMEILEVHRKNNKFMHKSCDVNQFESLLNLKIIGKSGIQRRASRKYYRDLYNKNGIIPKGLLYSDGRKASGRKTSLPKQVEQKFIEMVHRSASDNIRVPGFIPKKHRTIVNFHRMLEKKFGKVPLYTLRRLVPKYGLKKYLEKPDNVDEQMEKRFLKMVLDSTTDDINSSGFIPKKHRTIINFHRRLENEFGKISIAVIYSIILKHGLQRYIKEFDYEYEPSEPSVNKKYSTHIKVKNLKSSDREILQKWRKSNDKKNWERAVAILENSNLSFQQISLKIERPIRAIKQWIEDYNQYGLEGIKLKKKRDRTKTHEKNMARANRIIEILHKSPRDFGINRSNWSQPSIAIVYEKKYNEKMPVYRVSRLIKNYGYKWNKAKNVLYSADPNYREKVELVLKTLWSLQPVDMFFFIDELGPLRVKKYGGRCYTRKGETVTIPQNPSPKGSITLYGALSATTNQVTWNFGKSKDTSKMIDLIEILFNQYYNKSKIYVTWDTASWHRSNQLVEWLDLFNAQTKKIGKGPIIELVPLPSNSQFLNVIESVFSGMKRAVIHISNYQSEEEMKSAISLHFKERNEYFKENPKRAGKKIWEIDFFKDYNNIKSGNYREW